MGMYGDPSGTVSLHKGVFLTFGFSPRVAVRRGSPAKPAAYSVMSELRPLEN
jgi:hypothetical protein